MESILTLDVLNKYVIPDINDIIFEEYCNDLDQLSLFLDPEFYLESHVDKRKGLKRDMGTIMRNTKDTTKKLTKIYGDFTDAGGAMYKGNFDIITSSIGLIAKIISFLMKRIFEIPTKISKIIDSISSIPETIKSKIRGDIRLYITADDLGFFYNRVFFMIRNFINYADQMSRGEAWVTLFSSMKRREKLSNIIFSKSDLKCGDHMKKIYSSLVKIEFDITTVELKDFNTVNIYFGTADVINFIDIYGKQHHTSYYDALISLMKDIGGMKKELENIQKTIGEKLEKSQVNQTMSELSPGVQKRIVENIMMISKVINIIGNLIRYILIDMNTIEKNAAKLLKKGKIMLGDPTTGKPKDIDTKHIPKVNTDI